MDARDINALKQQAVKFTQSRNFLLIVVAFTAVNLLLFAFEADWYFLFSATVPLFIAGFGQGLAEESANNGFFILGLILAFAVVAAYFACWLFANRARALILVALILFGIDCLGLLWLMSIVGFDASFILDIVFHGWIIFSLISGTAAWSKLRGVSTDDFNAILQGAGPAPAVQSGNEGPFGQSEAGYESSEENEEQYHTGNEKE
ncbi:MAG: hypothetical protein FWD39_02020 [Clostridiales bacterium]|nr:hypothetical protein [Clostridiales bacterium]